jgi:hypothetical protein
LIRIIAPLLGNYLHRIKYLLNDQAIHSLTETKPGLQFSVTQTVYYGHYILHRFKGNAKELIDIYGRLDARYSMAVATKNFNMSLPVFVELDKPFVHATSLYHILLHTAVAYDIQMDQESNFCF